MLMAQASPAEERGTWALSGGEEDGTGGLSSLAVRVAVLALVGLAVWWLVLQLQKPVPHAPPRIQQITILQEFPPQPPEPEPQIEERPLARTAPDIAFEAPAPRPLPTPAAPPEETAPPEVAAERSPQSTAGPEPAPAIAQAEDSYGGEIAAGTAGPGGSATGTGGTGHATGGGGSSSARWDADHLGNTKPPYPHLARARGHEGTALILVLVSPAGLPVEVRLKQSSGSSLLDRSALEAVRGWRFVPAQEKGTPVAAWLLIPVVFTLQG
jgi:protein TonB